MTDPALSRLQARLLQNSVLSTDTSYAGTPCWLWIGTLNADGYGHMSYRVPGVKSPRKALAHRKSYEAFRGPIPEGAVLCHGCNVRRCINPMHLTPGTQSENIQQCVAEGRHRTPWRVDEEFEYPAPL